MRKFLAIVCFVIGSLLILFAVASAIHSLFFNNHQYSTDIAFNMGYITGCLMFPALLIVMAIIAIQLGRKLTSTEEEEDTEAVDPTSV